MKTIITSIAFIIVCSLFSQVESNNISTEQNPTIRIQSGILRGLTEDGVDIYKGIPYAAPPIGELRWRPPQPITPWEGVRDASEYGHNCAQSGRGGAPGSIAEGSSEDCLYLNVWAPSKSTAKDKLPVMLWIHGGGFVGGSGSGLSGKEFAKQDVILITFNYRLGRLGHFAFPALSAEHPKEPKGSYAFMDQIAALKWIQQNISSFGGDRDNATIFGFSAGGVSIHSLLTIPSARGLFHKAISQSGGGRDGVLTGREIKKENASSFYPITAETIGLNFARKHGIMGRGADALAQLRALSVEDIVDNGQETDSNTGERTYAGPILDGKLIVETAESAYKSGRQANVPLIIGNSSAEIGGSFVNNSQTKDELFSLFGELKEEAKAAYDFTDSKDFSEVITRFNTDWVWGEPARMTARIYTSHNNPVYMYHFDYVPARQQERMRYGASHGSEVPYVFNVFNFQRENNEVSAEEKKLARMMNMYWVNFAKTGNPNGKGLPTWPVYNFDNESILDVKPDGIPIGEIDPRKERFDVIENASHLRKKIQTRGI